MGAQEDRKWKSTVVFFSIDAYGHINPTLTIVKELRERQIRAIILTTRPLSMAPHLESMGFELDFCEKYKSEGTQVDESNQGKIEMMTRSLIDVFRHGVKQAFIGTYCMSGLAGEHLNDVIAKHDVIEAKLKSLKPDLIVFDNLLGVPCATTVAPKWIRTYSAFPSILFSSYNDNYVAGMGVKPNEVTQKLKTFEHQAKLTLQAKLKKFFVEKGVEPWKSPVDLAPESPYLNFYLGPQELGLDLEEHLKPLPKNKWFRLEHTQVHDANGEPFSIPDKLQQLSGKLIYFSLGTLASTDPGLISRLLKMLSNSPNKFIISMGQMHKYVKLYPNMWGQKFIEQKKVLPVVDLFITHGGHNSVIEAFYFGVPGLIVLPVFADQFDCAQRVQDRGFGIRLNPFECSQDELLNSIDSLLSNSELRQRMHAVGARMRSIRYDKIAADKIEQLLVA